MVTPERVRRVALALPGVLERRRGGLCAFEVGPRVFVTLAPRQRRALLQLSRREREVLTRAHPRAFAAAPKRRRGLTVVELGLVDPWLFEELLVASWRRVVPRRLAARWDEERASAALPAAGGAELRRA